MRTSHNAISLMQSMAMYPHMAEAVIVLCVEDGSGSFPFPDAAHVDHQRLFIHRIEAF